MFVSNIRFQFETLKCCRGRGVDDPHHHLESQSTRSFFHPTFNIQFTIYSDTVILDIFTNGEIFLEHSTSQVTYEHNLTNLWVGAAKWCGTEAQEDEFSQKLQKEEEARTALQPSQIPYLSTLLIICPISAKMASEKGTRPGRHRTVTKYTEDAFETAGLPVDEPDIIDPRLRTQGDDSDEEFEVDADERAEVSSDHGDNIPEDGMSLAHAGLNIRSSLNSSRSLGRSRNEWFGRGTN